ncbi:MAG: alkyl sulfatase dimerization domain-containing protein [Actinomycetota bacterium]|nr:alkyl sulfatase dimerization domain-containing protein [Actinomycetota bacterium]
MSLHPKPRDLKTIRTEDPIELSSKVIDEGVAEEPTNRVTNNLSEISSGIAVVESFSHMIAIRTDDGLVTFDSSGEQSGGAVVESLRKWSVDPVHSLVYTHGHLDHVGGSGAIIADAEKRNYRHPTVFGHENIPHRFTRYQRTNDWNTIINRRQFGGVSPKHGMGLTTNSSTFLPESTAWPDVVYQEEMSLSVGGIDIEFKHGKGETDDHTWAWIPSRKTLVTGDLVIWVFPNAGNPQKVQRYPLEWASALRQMMACEAELLLPAHGLPISGNHRIKRVLGDIADVLEKLVEDTLELMNRGETLDTIIHEVRVDDGMLELPWLKPLYDEPEFVVRNIWRMYGGWWDANPASLKPSPRKDLAEELAILVGGVSKLVERAQALATAGDFRMACHLIEFAAEAEPENTMVHGARAEIYRVRRANERSLMSKGIYAAAMRESEQITQTDLDS